MSKSETRLVHRIVLALGEEFPGAYIRKIHGNPFQHVGIPDLIGCIDGFFFGFEVKTEDGRVSEVQKVEGISILKSGGIYAVITSPEEAISAIKFNLDSKRTLG